MNKYSLDDLRIKSTFRYYRRVNIIGVSNRIVIDIRRGYSFFISRLFARWAEVSGATVIPDPKFSLEDGEQFIVLDQTASPIGLLSTPGKGGVSTVAAPARAFTATPVLRSMRYAHQIAHQGQIRCIIEDATYIGGTWQPEYIELVFEGYHLKQGDLI